MASLTIRKLDDAIKSYLRLRSAKNGRSVEEEVRVILREYCEGSPAPAAPSVPTSAPADRPGVERANAAGLASITLIIGGGIAAFKSLELIRRLKERHVDVRCVLTNAAQQFVTPLSASALSHERVYTDLFDPGSEFDAGHIRLARECDLIVVAPGDRRSDGEDGQWSRRRSRQRDPAGRRPTDPAGACDEPADVEQRRHPPQRDAA